VQGINDDRINAAGSTRALSLEAGRPTLRRLTWFGDEMASASHHPMAATLAEQRRAALSGSLCRRCKRGRSSLLMRIIAPAP